MRRTFFTVVFALVSLLAMALPAIAEADAGATGHGSINVATSPARGTTEATYESCGTEAAWEELMPSKSVCSFEVITDNLDLHGDSQVRVGHPKYPEAAVRVWITDADGNTLLSCENKGYLTAACESRTVLDVVDGTFLDCHVSGRGSGIYGCSSGYEVAATLDGGSSSATASGDATQTATASSESDDSSAQAEETCTATGDSSIDASGGDSVAEAEGGTSSPSVTTTSTAGATTSETEGKMACEANGEATGSIEDGEAEAT